MRRTLALVVGINTVVLTFGCGADDASQATPPEPTELQGPTQEELDAQLGAKLNVYVELINSGGGTIATARGSYQRYLSRHLADDVLSAPDPRMSVITSEVRLPASEISHANRVADDEPRLPQLESATTDYIAALTPLVAHLAEARSYYGSRLYSHDAMVHGRELHATLMGEFGAFEVASRAVAAALNEQQRGLRDRSIARLGQDASQRGAFLLETALAAAEDAVNVISETEFNDEGQVVGVTAETLEEAVATARAAQQAATSYVTENLASAGPQAANLTRELDEFVTAMQAIAPHIGGGEWSEDAARTMSNGGAERVAGTPQHAIHQYNECVRAMTSWRRSR